MSWEALLEYARGVRDQQAGKTEDALCHLRETNRRASKAACPAGQAQEARKG